MLAFTGFIEAGKAVPRMGEGSDLNLFQNFV